MLSRFLRIESYRRGIVFSSTFNFIAKLLLFLQGVLIAYYFGTNEKTDIYFFAFGFISLLSVFINSLDSSVLIPESMRLEQQNSKKASMSFLNFFIYTYLIIALVLVCALYIDPVKSFSFFSKFREEQIVSSSKTLFYSVPLLVFMVLTNLLSNILASHKFFTMPMLASIINNTMALLFVFFFHDKLGIISVLLGLSCAYLLNIFLLIFLMKRELKWQFSIINFKVDARVYKNIFYAQAGNITSAFSSYVPLYLLSGFNPGIIAALSYGQKTADMPHQLITSQFSSVLGIKLNDLYTKRNYEELNSVFLKSTKFLLFILTPISALIFLYSDTVIALFYQRGAFDALSVHLSAEFLKYFGLLLPMLAINTHVSRLFMAGQKIKQAFIYQAGFNFFLFFVIYFGIKYYGIIGYPLSLIIFYIFNMIFCYILIKILFPCINYLSILFDAIKIIVLNFILGWGIFFFTNMFDNRNTIFVIIFSSFLFIILLIIINFLLKINVEFNDLILKLKYKFQRL